MSDEVTLIYNALLVDRSDFQPSGSKFRGVRALFQGKTPVCNLREEEEGGRF